MTYMAACDFCGRTEAQVGPMVQSADKMRHVCRECAEAAARAFAEAERPEQPEPEEPEEVEG